MSTSSQTPEAAAAESAALTVRHYLGQARFETWLAGASCAVAGTVLVIRTPFDSAKHVLERSCGKELREATERLLGPGASWRIDVVTGRRVPVTSGRNTPQELFR